jgi:uncharacterized DUF497 family protein
LKFEWNDEKAAANVAKHRVSFDEAETVFADALAGIAPDPDHSMRERREIIAGLSAAGRLLLVSFTERWSHPHHQCPRTDFIRTSTL